jgi:hypothetical protein
MNYLITDQLPTPLRYGVLRSTPRSSVVAITDASGSLLEESRYMPFACPRSSLSQVIYSGITGGQSAGVE